MLSQPEKYAWIMQMASLLSFIEKHKAPAPPPGPPLSLYAMMIPFVYAIQTLEYLPIRIDINHNFSRKGEQEV